MRPKADDLVDVDVIINRLGVHFSHVIHLLHLRNRFLPVLVAKLETAHYWHQIYTRRWAEDTWISHL